MFHSTPSGGQFEFVRPPARTGGPHGGAVHRTRRQADEFKKNTHPKLFTALFTALFRAQARLDVDDGQEPAYVSQVMH